MCICGLTVSERALLFGEISEFPRMISLFRCQLAPVLKEAQELFLPENYAKYERSFCMKKKTLIALITAAVMSTFGGLTAYASGDVAGAVESTWSTARAQVVSVVDNVIFPVIDVILAVLLFVKIALAYLDYRKHGQLEWTPIAIIFGCLIFTLTAPLYIWSIV